MPARQRKVHVKSRSGCGNCKLRSIKCDETHPACTRCSSAGYTCSYNRSAAALQLALPGTFIQLDLATPPQPCRTVSINKPNDTTAQRASARKSNHDLDLSRLSLPLPLPPPPRPLRAAVSVPLAVGDYEMLPSDFAALDRFVNRSVWTLGRVKWRRWYGERALSLASSHPYILHTFIAYTLLHDIYHTPSKTLSPAQRASHAFHAYHGTALFQQQLAKLSATSSSCYETSSVVTPSCRDAIWVSAALLGAAAFANVDAPEPGAAWPLREPSAMDLDWLKMSYGKRSIRHIADPSRPDSIFHEPESKQQPPLPLLSKHTPIPLTSLPPSFYPLFNLSSDPSTNPYHLPAAIIAAILYEPITDHNAKILISFLVEIETPFYRLLEKRDPRALLLLAYWYAKTAHSEAAWWVRPRAEVEGKAICVYLERHCAENEAVMELLAFPKAMLSILI